MDIELASKSLRELETKRRTINLGANLDRECQTIKELDDKIVNLTDNIKDLHSIIEQLSGALDNDCEKLNKPNGVLLRSCEAFEFASKLTKLNRICRQLDTSPCLKFFESNGRRQTTTNNKQPCSSNNDNHGTTEANRNNSIREQISEDNNDGDDEDDAEGLVVDKQAMIKIVQGLVNDFQGIYSDRFKIILDQRKDLPYSSYAARIETVKLYLSSI